MRPRSVKPDHGLVRIEAAASRASAGNFHEIGDVRPHQSGADRPAGIELREHGAVERQLRHIALVVLLRFARLRGAGRLVL